MRYLPIAEHLNEFHVELIPSWDGESFAFRGQLTPGAYAMVVERFGIELDKAAYILLDLEAAEHMTAGGRIVKGNKTYSLEVDPKPWDALNPTFAEVAAKEIKV